MGDEAPRSAGGSPSDGGSPEAVPQGRASDEGQSEARRAVAAQRLAALALAKDEDDLVELQRAAFAPERTPSRERLAVAKTVVDHLGRALESNAEADWRGVEASVAALTEVAEEAAITDEDRSRPDIATMSTDVPPPPDRGRSRRSVATPSTSPPISRPRSCLRKIPPPADSERTAVSALAVPDVPEETMVSAVPVDAVVAELAKRARLAKLSETNEHTLVEAGVIADAMNRARELLDSSEHRGDPSVGDSGALARPGRVDRPRSQEGGTVQLSFSSMAHGFALTVEEYAALCAERDDDPSRLGALRARYGIPELRGHAALDRYFEWLFLRDPAMKALWQRHYQRYTEIVRKRPAR